LSEYRLDVLVVDDEPLQRDILQTILREEGYDVETASSVDEALQVVKENPPKIILTDLKMPDRSGMELLDEINNMKPHAPPAIIIMTAFGTISSAVEAIKKGAYDYLTKPLDKETVVYKVKQALERQNLLYENLQLKDALYEKFNIQGIVGKSSVMKELINTMKKVAPTNATVLILGESGTGKELVARALHYNSPRRNRPFTAINCASIPENLLESELFGYEPGAFTGATSRKRGLIEATSGGTLFLDEIGDMPLNLQAKLLRVLQDGEVRRLGGKESFKVDIRTVAATHQDLERLVDEGLFRQDLYYRLRVVTLRIPPLRERKEDIPLLTDFFIERFSREYGRELKGMDREALQALMGYDWPGNVRQLQSVIERAVIMSEGEMITLRDVKDELTHKKSTPGTLEIELPDEGIIFEELEKALLRKAMEKANNVAKKAAELLGMSYKTFWYRWEKYGLRKDDR